MTLLYLHMWHFSENFKLLSASAEEQPAGEADDEGTNLVMKRVEGATGEDDNDGANLVKELLEKMIARELLENITRREWIWQGSESGKGANRQASWGSCWRESLIVRNRSGKGENGYRCSGELGLQVTHLIWVNLQRGYFENLE